MISESIGQLLMLLSQKAAHEVLTELHARGELAPRDVLARAVAAADASGGAWLDARGIENFPSRFPGITAMLGRLGLDPARDLLPVAPALHYAMGGIPTEATIALESDDPEFVDFRKNTPKEQIDKYFKTIGVMDAINYVPYAAPTPLLFQFARYERYFNEAAMLKYARAASEPKIVEWYDTGHDLNDVQALIDRANWLQRQIGIKPVLPILQMKLSAIKIKVH